MKLARAQIFPCVVFLAQTSLSVAFTVSFAVARTGSSRLAPLASSTVLAAADVPAAAVEPADVTEESNAMEEVDLAVPTVLPSDCGMDYIPLATMLATGQLTEADQV